MIKVAIADDHLMVLKGLESMLGDSDEMEISSTYTDGRSLLVGVASELPDVLLLDINMPDLNGIELCKEISEKYPEISIIGLSNFSDTNYIKNMLRNGASGYLLKNTDKTEITRAIVCVHNGGTFLPQNLQKLLIKESIGSPANNSFIPKITRREKEVLELISREYTNQEIAEKLFISIKTVENHRSNLIQKLNVKNTAGLVRAAFEKGLIS